MSTETKMQNQLGYHRAKPTANGHGQAFDFLIDLRSDTVTSPGSEMRSKMASAIVGDDVMGEDPTVKELEQRMAQIMGKEDGIFIPSGSMGNLIATMVHCNERGAEAIVGSNAHMFKYEQGSMAQIAGVQANIIQNEPNGTFSIAKIIDNIRAHHDFHYPKTSLICLENTHNMCGGRILPLEWIDKVAQIGRNYSIPLHMDGARIFNASVGSGVPVQRIVQDFASVSICLSKGLGAPVGSVLVGSTGFIQQARRMRKALGGGMRQAGIIAAAGLYCLDHMIDRLADDHANTKHIAKSVHSLKNPILTVDYNSVETNILLLNVNSEKYLADDVCARFSQVTEQEKVDLGNSICVLASPKSNSVVRLVLHCDVSREMTEKAADKICYVAKELSAA